jgi:hypothetical protein
MLILAGDEVQVYCDNKTTWSDVGAELLDQYPVLLFTKINAYGFIREVKSLQDVEEVINIINTWENI